MNSVPVLMYHHVAPDRDITPHGFERQLKWLKENGFRSLSLAEFYAHLTGEKLAPDRSIVITFDDGYADNWVYAFPIIKKYAMRAILFVATAYISASNKCRPTSEEGGRILDTQTAERAPEGFLNWQELKTMLDSGLVEVGSHTHAHKNFLKRDSYKNLEMELEKSREEVTARIGQWSGAIAWPWGDFQDEWLALLPKNGYRMAFTTKVGSNLPGRNPFLIRRFKVKEDGIGALAKRLWLFRRPFLADFYSRFHGSDRKLKLAIKKYLDKVKH